MEKEETTAYEDISGLDATVYEDHDQDDDETGQLYGSVTIRDIAAAIKEAGFDVERRYVYLEKPIKDLGIYQVKLNLHPEVSQTILINVARTPDEAAKQEKAFSQE